MTLNINSKTLFLTYSQVNQDGIDRFVSTPSDHFDFVSSSLGTPTRYRLARESHQDGGTSFSRLPRFRERCAHSIGLRLDFGQHHPNISRFEQAIVELGTTSERMVTSSTRSATRLINWWTSGGRGDSVWSEAVRAESEEEFYSILRDGAPRYYILYHRQLEQYAAKFYGVRPQPYESPTFTDLTGPRIAEWKSQATIGDNGGGHRRRSLILWGPTRTGKTVWARSLGTLSP